MLFIITHPFFKCFEMKCFILFIIYKITKDDQDIFVLDESETGRMIYLFSNQEQENHVML
ncbi:hypothetical protein XI25_23750 [Paenibacillus sp. DMB20]|nr:hypothetical protein XI25_23750 [Paenibacillus sp. DMB20]